MAQATPAVQAEPVPQFRIQNEQRGQVGKFTSEPNLWQSEEGAPYDKLDFSVSYMTREGVVQMPVASADPEADCVFARLHSRITTKVVNWSVCREGKPPKMPPPESIDRDSILLDHQITGAYPMPTENGKNVTFFLAGIYVFGLRKALDHRKGIPLGRLPIVNASREQFTVGPEHFDPTLIG